MSKTNLPAQEESKTKYQGEIRWFHIFKSMIASGDARKMGPSTFLVYATVKAHSNFNTGQAFPSVSTLSELTGLSARQVLRCLNTLESFGYINKEKVGRKNVYTLREKIDFYDKNSGKAAGVATWDYLPSSVQEVSAELRNFFLSGLASEENNHIHIETLNLTIQAGNNNIQQVVINTADSNSEIDSPEEVADSLIKKLPRNASLRKSIEKIESLRKKNEEKK